MRPDIAPVLPGSRADMLVPSVLVWARSDQGIDWDNPELADQRPGGVIVGESVTDDGERCYQVVRLLRGRVRSWDLLADDLHWCAPLGDPDCPACPHASWEARRELDACIRAVAGSFTGLRHDVLRERLRLLNQLQQVRRLL